MTERHNCATCGKRLPEDAPHGLCPECLLLGGLGSGAMVHSQTAAQVQPAKAKFVPPALDDISVKFPQLEVLELLGHGGMGAVYKARQKQLDRMVALKILPHRVEAGHSISARFVREAQALAKLNHPNIVTLYEFGQADGLFFFLMEYVDGVSLGRLLQNSRVSPREALAIVPQICHALQYAHDRGIVHRDIKPDNILLSREGQVKIADFGVAKLVGLGSDGEPATDSPVADLTRSDTVIGTPRYMAPEQLERPLEVDHRADIYSLGVVFYQMLTGKLPSGRLDAPSRRVSIDVRLDEVVLRALDTSPERRYQHANELRETVETIAANMRDLETKGDPPPNRLLTWLRWTARVIGTLMSSFILLNISGQGMPPIGGEPAIATSFLGLFMMVAGGFYGWKHEGRAALLLLLGWVLRGIIEGHPEFGFFTPFPVVGVLYAICWWWQNGRRTGRVVGIAVALIVIFLLGRWLVPASVWVRGSVLDAQTGAPVPEAQLFLEGARRRDGKIVPSGRANASGRFTLYIAWYLPQQRVRVEASGYQPLAEPLGPKPRWTRTLQHDYKLDPLKADKADAPNQR